jgi:prepilin-type N-terminal cleavage/methylation domain-containing protein
MKLIKSNGFTLIELLIAIGLSALFLPALVFVFSFSLSSASQGESYTQAYTLAQEKMEAVYYLKENELSWDWINLPDNNGVTDFYQPGIIGGDWQLGSKTTSPAAEEGFITTVKILPVSRSGGDISEESWSLPDPLTRKIIVKVSWKEKGVDTYIDLISYVSRH